MNNYIKTKIKISPVALSGATGDALSWDDISDILNATIAPLGFETFEKEKPFVYAYIQSRVYDADNLKKALKTAPLSDVAIVELKETREIPGEDWNREWEKNYFQPYVFGKDKCIIHSSFHKNLPNCEYDIIIDPKMAFGTGHHSTTRLMVEALFDTAVEGKKVMDVGTGSAVLSILASKLRAKSVLAVEIDDAAYENALENIKLNECHNVEVLLGEVYAVREGMTFDIVLANINRNIIIDDLPEYVRRTARGGRIFLSGFYEEDVPLIEERAQQCKLKLDYHKTDSNWTVLGYIKE